MNLISQLKEKTEALQEREEYIKHLSKKLKSLEEYKSRKESKERNQIKEKAEENKMKFNLDKVSIHKYYTYENEEWCLISNKHLDKTIYQWINIKDTKMNLNSNYLKKYFMNNLES
jgi:hypothetical protein